MKSWKKLAVLSAVLLLQPVCGSVALAQPTFALADPDVRTGYYVEDLNDDGTVNVADVGMLQSALIGTGDAAETLTRGDFNHDGTCNIFDLNLLKMTVLGNREPEWIGTSTETPTDPEEGGDEGSETGSEDALIPATVSAFQTATPSVGDVKMLSIYVDFADVTYRSDAYTTEEIQRELFGNGETAAPYESITAWYERASYGNLHIDGDVYRYTCSGNLADYQQDSFEKMVMEVLTGLDGQIDFGDYDSNGDGIIDCISFTVPLDDADDATKAYWYGCTATWYENPSFAVDGMALSNYIIMDVMPNAEDMTYLKQTLLHEMGHSLGLPDYYKYQSSDWEGLHGDAGYERMDDSIGDFCSFSKLMYGWLKSSEVQAYTGSGTQTFQLSDASNVGSCLILPITSTEDDYTSEYFLVEYVTNTGNNSDIYTEDSGVRIFHIQAETATDAWDRTAFKYENYAETYLGDDKIRVIRLVGDNSGFYHAGDTIQFGTTNFAAYDTSGNQTIDTGYTITVGTLTDGTYPITVTRTN
jgi:M6 family metalloprotease-like protein